jgi:hypothetical protein
MKSYIVIILMFAVVSCAPDKFILRKMTDYLVEGYILKNVDSVEVKLDNTMELSSGSMVALRTFGITETHFDMTTELLEGEGAEFYFRTAIDKFDVHPALKFKLSSSGCNFYENNNLLGIIDSIKFDPKNNGRLHIRNNGNKYLVTYNCDTLKYGSTSIENSEFLIIKPLPGSKIRIKTFDVFVEDGLEEFNVDKKNHKIH